MTYPLTRELCESFKVEGLLKEEEEEDAEQRRQQKLTVYDLFSFNYAELHELAVQKNVPFNNLIKLRQELSKQLIGESVSLYSVVSQNPGTVKVRCGSERLSVILGKMPWLRTIDVCGPNDSGKSYLACSLAFQSALAGTHVFFIDSNMSFCWRQRFYSVFHSASILSHVTVVPIFTLDKLIAYLENFPRLEHAQNSLLIIDSLDTLLHSERSNYIRMNFKQKKFTKEAIAWQFFEALKFATRSTCSVGVFTRSTIGETKHLSESFCEANLQLALSREEKEDEMSDGNSTIEVKLCNRTCEQPFNCSAVINIEFDELLQQHCPMEE